jgi:2-polyprenyl-6-methoxyphenol hydroxylase-like FAD-dependent oxidoreductase
LEVPLGHDSETLLTEADFDVLIVGGGPAGLLTASYLAPKHRVALIERGVVGRTDKFWMTSEVRLRKHALEHCVLNRPSVMTCGTFLGARVSIHGDFVVVDDEHLLGALVERCRSRGARLIGNCALLNLSWTKERLRVQTSTGDFLVRLVVDATGGASLVARTFRPHKVSAYYSIYGALLQNIRLHSQEIVLAYVNQLGHPPPMLEVFPTGAESAYCVVFVCSRSAVAPHTLADAFEIDCRRNPFFETTANTKRGEIKAGVIPLGLRRRWRLRGVTAVGEAGLIQPPFTGAAFNATLEHSIEVCNQISRALQRTQGIAEVPTISYPALKNAQDMLQLLLIGKLGQGNVEWTDQLLRALSRFPEELVGRMLGNHLTWSELTHMAVRFPFYLLKESRNYHRA